MTDMAPSAAESGDPAADPADELQRVEAVRERMQRLMALLTHVTGTDETSPLAALPPDVYRGHMADAYRRTHQRFMTAAGALYERSEEQLARLTERRNQLRDGDPGDGSRPATDNTTDRDQACD